MSKQLTVIKEETLDAVTRRVEVMTGKGELHLPPHYSAPNALKSAWLILQETKDKNDKPALEVCTKASILNSLLNMVIMAMNPAKKQVYFIVYGKQLACQRSYFGSMALAKRVDPEIDDIIAEPVYEADELEYEIIRGRKQIVKHKQTLEAVDSKKVKAAYCMVILKDGEIKRTDLMTFEEIKKSWKKSKMEPVNKDGTIKAGSTHDLYIAEMCRRTVINRTCKPIINSSDDKHLKIAAMRSEVVEAEEDALLQIEENANQEVIDVDTEPEDNGKEEKKAAPPVEETNEEKSEKKEAPKKEGAQGEGNNQYVYCPKSHRPTPIAVCETNKCKQFLTCETVQDKIAKLMEAERVAAAEEVPEGSDPTTPRPGF